MSTLFAIQSAEMKSVICVFACVALAVLGEARKMPCYVQICKVTDPAYDACVLKSVETLRPRLMKGISRMHIPPLDPFTLPELEINRDLNVISGRLRLKNIRAFGGSNFRIESIKTDPIKLTGAVTVALPVFSVEAEYDLNGRLLMLARQAPPPLMVRGNFTGNFTNLRAVVTGKGMKSTVNATRRLVVSELKATIRVMGVTNVTLVNNPQDTSNANVTVSGTTFFNQNQQMVSSAIYPILDETVQEVMIQYANYILSTLDYDKIFPRN